MRSREFWNRYLGASSVDRLEMTRRLLEKHVHACFRAYQEDRELGVYCMASIVNSFLEDLVNTLKGEGDA